MKITKKFLMKIIKEELLREEREVRDYDQSNFVDRKGRPDQKAYKQHLEKLKKYDHHSLAKQVGRNKQYSVELAPEDIPPLPPATREDILSGELREETGYYTQVIKFNLKKKSSFFSDSTNVSEGTWKRYVYSPGGGAIIYEDSGNMEDYPMG